MHATDEPLTANPLLDLSGLPRFAEIAPRHVGAAVDALIADARAAIDRVATLPDDPSFDNFVMPLADAMDRLDRAWGQVGHLNAVVNTPALREAYNANLPKVTAYHTDFGQDPRLFARYRALAAASASARLDPAQRRLIDNALRDFRLSGAELPDDKKARFKAVEEELASLTSRYEDNLLDVTNAWAHYVDDAVELAGIPADVLGAARQAAADDGKAGWTLSLRMPCYQPVLQYAERPQPARDALPRYATRASEFGKPEWDNTAVIERVLDPAQEAALLGYRVSRKSRSCPRWRARRPRCSCFSAISP
jgi:oligopeptidase A